MRCLIRTLFFFGCVPVVHVWRGTGAFWCTAAGQRAFAAGRGVGNQVLAAASAQGGKVARLAVDHQRTLDAAPLAQSPRSVRP